MRVTKHGHEQGRLWSFLPWYSKAVWPWSQAAKCQWPCLSRIRWPLQVPPNLNPSVILFSQPYQPKILLLLSNLRHLSSILSDKQTLAVFFTHNLLPYCTTRTHGGIPNYCSGKTSNRLLPQSWIWGSLILNTKWGEVKKGGVWDVQWEVQCYILTSVPMQEPWGVAKCCLSWGEPNLCSTFPCNSGRGRCTHGLCLAMWSQPQTVIRCHA